MGNNIYRGMNPHKNQHKWNQIIRYQLFGFCGEEETWTAAIQSKNKMILFQNGYEC